MENKTIQVEYTCEPRTQLFRQKFFLVRLLWAIALLAMTISGVINKTAILLLLLLLAAGYTW